MTGSGPIQLSADIQKAYKEYLLSDPIAFAVSEDGSSSWSGYTCADSICGRDTHRVMSWAIGMCERRSNGSACKIYDVAGRVVWKQL